MFHCRASFQLAVPPQLLPHKIIATQVQHSALLRQLHENPVSSSPGPSVPGVSKTPPSLVPTAKLQGALSSIVRFSKGVKQELTHYS